MKKRFMAMCMAIVMIAVAFTVAGVKDRDDLADVSYAQRNTYGESETAKTTLFTNPVDNFIGNKVEGASNAYDVLSDLAGMAGDIGGSVTIGSGDMGGIGDALGGIGDALGGIGDAFGGVFGEDTNATQSNQGVTYSVVETNVGHIQVVPAATQNYGTTPQLPGGTVAVQTHVVSTTGSLNTAETVDFAALKNPYQKPTGVLKGGDTGEGVKWMQWIFIYTRYGLKDDGITGVFDEDTMAVVKKLQKENNMTVDGIVNDAVIDKIELLYFQTTYTQPTLAPSTTSAGTKLTSPVVVPEQDNTVIILLVVLIVLVWIVAIAFVATMVIKSKKKKSQNQKKTEEKEKTEAPADKTETPDEIK